MRGRKPLSKATRKLLAELFVTKRYVLKYKTWDSVTGDFSQWIDIYTDGVKVYETQEFIPWAGTKDPLRYNQAIVDLQIYVVNKYNPSRDPLSYGDPARIQLYDYTRGEGYKPQFNRNHPWCK